MAKVELRGADVLIAKLKKNATFKDVKDVVRLNGGELQKKAQRNAPVDTGHLKRSIKPPVILDNGLTAKVAAEADYSGYVNFGTRFMYPRPFMTNAFNQQKSQFKADMNRLMK